MILKPTTIRKRRSIVLILTMILSMLPVSIAAAKGGEKQDYKIVGYYTSWSAYSGYQALEIDAKKLSHINYAFADICWDNQHGNPNAGATWSCQDVNGDISMPNGSIVLGDPWIDVQKPNEGETWSDPIRGNFSQLMKLKQANPHLQTLISVGGWTWSNRFSDVAASAQTREQFADSAVDFLRKYHFDGVDLDWEYPVGGGLDGNSARPEDKQNYTLLLQNVRKKLDAAGKADGKHYLLTIASGASQSFVNHTELKKIAKVVDWINIMTYDFNGTWQKTSAHNAPLYDDPAAKAAGVNSGSVHSAVRQHLGAGVPAGKLVLGMPFYGHGWDGCPALNNGEYQVCAGGSAAAGSVNFSVLQDQYINKNGYTRYWNDKSKVPFLYNPTNGTFISYDDEQSVGHKTAYIASNKLAGAMFWELGGDRNNTLLSKLAADLLSQKKHGGHDDGDEDQDE
ncbi:glycoside hydrolase family 18 protein [Cohnella pontilimi]|uniref:chitinase n=1 Tax=Cohnella pontilimi TaxID=2564100 RepID=A0A4U0FCV0_9BACL|nr:glycoside hydrolase family 18 protein [Cohnella pontilimi]